jgi:surface polysaccharide O-acyltransferase-like enzyme
LTKLIQERIRAVPADLIRTIAIIGVITLHAANEAIAPQVMNQTEIYRWWTVNIYQTLGRTGVPLFVMLTGTLLLQPSKIESLNVFFKKRWNRIGIPFLFWGAIYFAWDYYANHLALTTSFVFQGILSGPYFQFWYLYMIVGLYLLTPILRIIVAHIDRRTFKYFFVVWFFTAFITPIPGLIGTFYIDSNLLTLPLWVGYFMFGAFLMNVTMQRRTLIFLTTLGLVLSVIGTYIIAATIGGSHTYYFQDYFSPTMILASAALFLLLNTIKAPTNQTETSQSKINWLLKQISQSTLAIFLFHVIVIETLQRGYLWGFTISGNNLNSILEVPLMTVVTLFICLGVILPLRKVPVIKKLIG